MNGRIGTNKPTMDAIRTINGAMPTVTSWYITPAILSSNGASTMNIMDATVEIRRKTIEIRSIEDLFKIVFMIENTIMAKPQNKVTMGQYLRLS